MSIYTPVVSNAEFHAELVKRDEFKIVLRAETTLDCRIIDCEILDFLLTEDHLEIHGFDSLGNDRCFWRENGEITFDDIYHSQNDRRWNLSFIE